MKVYGFDLLPWPHLDAPSYYPDSNALFDPARGMAVYAEHIDQMAMFWQKLLSYHRGSMKLLGLSPPARPPIVRSAEELPLYEFDFDLTQKEGLTFVGDPDYVTREIRAHMQELGAGVIMGLFQFGSLPHALATRNMELFAKTVLPALRRD